MGAADADIVIIDDDKWHATRIANLLADRGKYSVCKTYSADQAIELVSHNRFRLAILDVRMDPGHLFDSVETAGGHQTGVVLVREVRNRLPGIKVIVHTSSTDHQLEVWFAGNPDVSLLHKDEGDRALLRAVNAALDPGYHNWNPFIVHGRDRTSVLELKAFLRDRLGFPEPMVLSEMPSTGLTVIEKFERYASQADVVFVLITPDDLGQLAGVSKVTAFRARQNVIFEIGYFLGLLRRQSGRVFLLHKGSVEIPSDLAGLVYIDIENGIESAGERIRRELAALL